MSVDSETDKVSDHLSFISPDILEQLSEQIKIDVKPQSIKHESLLPEEEFKRIH
jgi:hypothetical protein